nr:MAG TPA: hypothetical protein [Bacteriophage sp.]
MLFRACGVFRLKTDRTAAGDIQNVDSVSELLNIACTQILIVRQEVRQKCKCHDCNPLLFGSFALFIAHQIQVGVIPIFFNVLDFCSNIPLAYRSFDFGMGRRLIATPRTAIDRNEAQFRLFLLNFGEKAFELFGIVHINPFFLRFPHKIVRILENDTKLIFCSECYELQEIACFRRFSPQFVVFRGKGFNLTGKLRKLRIDLILHSLFRFRCRSLESLVFFCQCFDLRFEFTLFLRHFIEAIRRTKFPVKISNFFLSKCFPASNLRHQFFVVHTAPYHFIRGFVR